MDDAVDLLVHDADLVVTMAETDLDGGWVAVHGGVVVSCGSSAEPPPAARTLLDARGCIVTPGLINTHHHMYQNLTRNWAAEELQGGLIPWLQQLYPAWARLDEESVYLSTWVAAAELALGGCTTTCDHLNVHPKPKLIDAQVLAAADVGLRFHATRGAMDLSEKDGALPPDSTVQDLDAILDDFARLVDLYHDPSPTSMLQIGLAPCNPFAISDQLLVETAALADRLGVTLHTHLAESPDEEAYCLEHFGCRPAERLERSGWFDLPSWVAHAIFIDDRDVAALGSHGVGVAHCPTSNVLFNRALTPARSLRAAGAPVGLGTDGGASAGNGSLYNEARMAALVGDLLPGEPRFSARDALEMGTLDGARCLDRAGEIGVLRPGAAADLVVWPIDGLFFSGSSGDPVTGLLRNGPVRARDTIVAGRFVVRDGVLCAPGLEDVVARHSATSAEWRAAV